MYEEKILIGTDTTSGVAPQILDAIAEASHIKTLPYGNDIFTKECKNAVKNIAKLQERFAKDMEDAQEELMEAYVNILQTADITVKR